MCRCRRLNRTSDVPDDLRANFEELGEPVVAQLVGRPYTQATPGVPAWAKNEADRRHALSWLSEKRRRANRKQWIGWGVGWFLSLIVIGFAVYNRWLAIQEDRPNFVTTGARLYINHAGQPPPESVDITWGNTGKRSVLRGAATLFTVSEDGNRHEKFGVSEISDGATIVPTFGIGHVTIPVEMSKFLGRLLVCVKYYDETNHSCRQTFSFNEVRQLTMMF
jgi:hypothetical protein